MPRNVPLDLEEKKTDRERAIVASYYIGRAIYELENIALKDYEAREVKDALFEIVSSLADLEVEVRSLAERIRIY